MVMASKTNIPPVPTEVVPKARRRSFTASYKLDLLRRADGANGKPGAISELLRKEGLYTSHLAVWRKARAAGELNPKEPKKRGPKAAVRDARDRTIDELKREIAKLTARAERAEQLVEIQKKVAELLGPGPRGEKGEKP